MRRRTLALHPMLLMATFLVPAPTRVLAQFVAPHKVTLASSDPVAAAAFSVRYLGATRLDGKDGKPGSFREPAECAADGGATCGECTVGEWVAFRHTRLNMQDVPRGFVKLGFDSFHLHFVRHRHRPTGNLSIAAFERALAASHADFGAWDPWLDFRLVLRGRSLDALVVRPNPNPSPSPTLALPRTLTRILTRILR